MLFENRTGLRYLPVFHSSLKLNPAGGPVTIIAYLNWYVLAVLVYGIYRSIQDPSFTPVAFLIAVILVISYFSQSSIIRRLSEYIAE